MRIKSNGFYVYKLISRGVVVYVGQTRTLVQRLFTHKSDKGKLYDEIELTEVNFEEDLSLEEFKLIMNLKPKYNKDLPLIPYSFRKSRVVDIISGLEDSGIDSKDYYDIDNPDLTIKLNGKTFELWAKKGFKKEFEDQLKGVTQFDDLVKVGKLMNELSYNPLEKKEIEE